MELENAFLSRNNKIYAKLKHTLTEIINDSNILKNQYRNAIILADNAVVYLFSNIDKLQQ